MLALGVWSLYEAVAADRRSARVRSRAPGLP